MQGFSNKDIWRQEKYLFARFLQDIPIHLHVFSLVQNGLFRFIP